MEELMRRNAVPQEKISDLDKNGKMSKIKSGENK
jgi:hypothetical protein